MRCRIRFEDETGKKYSVWVESGDKISLDEIKERFEKEKWNWYLEADQIKHLSSVIVKEPPAELTFISSISEDPSRSN